MKKVSEESLSSFSPECFKQNGVIYIAKRDLLMKHCLMIGENAYAVETSELEAVDIDTEINFKIAEVLMNEKI
jgi:CMP-N,N'-diacetyllegionaminic acid synthase